MSQHMGFYMYPIVEQRKLGGEPAQMQTHYVHKQSET